MDNLDKQIREALEPNDRELIGNPDEGLRIDQLMLATFRTRNKFITIFGFIYSLAFLGLAIWCAVRFFQATETQHQLAWGFGATLCMMAVSMIKVWFWLEMQRIAVTREVKRVELIAAKLLACAQRDH